MKTKQSAHTLPRFIQKKLKEIHEIYFLNDPPSLVEVNAPRALMQALGKGKSMGIRWAVKQPLYAAAPELLEAAKCWFEDSDVSRMASGFTMDKLRAAIAKAEKGIGR